MAAVDFTGAPDWRGWPERRGCPLPIVSAVPAPLRLGGTVTGSLGASQQINRLGDRWTMAVETAAVDYEPEGRRWGGMLALAAREGGLFRLPQPGLRNYASGTVVAASATAAGKALPVSGLTPGSVVLAFQWISIVVGGRRYADQVTAQAVASAGGTATLALSNLLRAPVPAGAVIEIAVPKIEGIVAVSGGQDRKSVV